MMITCTVGKLMLGSHRMATNDDERGAVSQSTGHFLQFASDSSDSGSSESRLASRIQPELSQLQFVACIEESAAALHEKIKCRTTVESRCMNTPISTYTLSTFQRKNSYLYQKRTSTTKRYCKNNEHKTICFFPSFSADPDKQQTIMYIHS